MFTFGLRLPPLIPGEASDARLLGLLTVEVDEDMTALVEQRRNLGMLRQTPLQRHLFGREADFIGFPPISECEAALKKPEVQLFHGSDFTHDG